MATIPARAVDDGDIGTFISRLHRRRGPYNLANEKHVREQRAQMMDAFRCRSTETDDRLG